MLNLLKYPLHYLPRWYLAITVLAAVSGCGSSDSDSTDYPQAVRLAEKMEAQARLFAIDSLTGAFGVVKLQPHLYRASELGKSHAQANCGNAFLWVPALMPTDLLQ